jgi:histidine triad (HIT) family protein
MLPKTQIAGIKKQLLEQIEANFPEDKKHEIKTKIEKMNSEELEVFLKENGLIKDESKCIFCSIANGEIKSYKIAENDEAVAVLEINPISKGHVIIIPKIHSSETPKKALELAKEISEAIKSLKPKKIEVIPSSLFGHDILNVLPVYDNESLESPKIKVKEKELESLQEKLKKAFETQIEKLKEEKPKVKESKEEMISEKNTWLPRRIP